MLFLLYGPDTFRSRGKLALLRQKFLDANPAAAVVVREAAGLTVSEVEELVAPSLFADKRLIVIENIFTEASEALTNHLLSLVPEVSDDTMLIFWEGSDIERDNELFKILNQPARAEFFKALTPAETSLWTVRAAQARGLTLPSDLATYLASACSFDSWQIGTELAKLAAAGTPPSRALIDELVSKPLTAKAFDLLDYISAGNTAQANSLATRLLSSGEDPLRLLALIGYHLRTQIRVFDLNNRGANKPEIIKLTKLHPFAVQKALTQVSRLSRSWLVSSLTSVAECDWLIKSGQRSATNELIDLVVVLSTRKNQPAEAGLSA